MPAEALIERIDRDRRLLGNQSLDFLQMLLAGYWYVASTLKLSFDPGWDDYEFVDWLERKLGASSIGSRKSFQLVSLAVYDEREALDRFFEFLAEYRRGRKPSPTVMPAAEGGVEPSAAFSMTYRAALSAMYPRPTLYLGANSISRLRAWLDGFELALIDHHIQPADETEFKRLIARIHELRPTPIPCAWDRALRFDGEDEGMALNNFFDLCLECGMVARNHQERPPLKGAS